MMMMTRTSLIVTSTTIVIIPTITTTPAAATTSATFTTSDMLNVIATIIKTIPKQSVTITVYNVMYSESFELTSTQRHTRRNPIRNNELFTYLSKY